MKFLKSKKVNSALDRASSPVRGIWPRLSQALVGIVALLVIAFCIFTFYTPAAHYTSKLLDSNKYIALLDGLLNPFRTRHILLKSGLPIYDIKVKRQQFARIEAAVKQARKQGWMSDDLKVWANAQFIHEGRTYDVKVRVRGDLSAHWKGPKKSWRVKFTRQKIEHNGEILNERIYFKGKRQINLIIPIDREYTLAYFINSLMREKGLVVPRDNYVILRINGAIQGLYYEVEHFDKPLLASNKRPETTVFGQNDRAQHFDKYTKYGTTAASDSRFDIGSMRKQVEPGGELAMQAMDVLIKHSINPTPENFRRVRAVLDWEKYLKFRVITTLCNTNHVRFGSDNLRLYFDPSRGLLEPIPWDVHLVKMPREPGTIDFWNSHGPDEIQRATLLDPELRLERNKVLWEMVGDGGDSLIAKYRAMHERIRPFAWADVLYTPIQAHKMDVIKKKLEYNIRRVYRVLNNSDCNFTYKLEANDRAALEFLVNNFSGIELQEIEISDSLLFEGKYSLYEDLNNNGELDDTDPLLDEVVAENSTIRFEFANRKLFPGVEYGGDEIDGRYWEYFATIANRKRFILVGKLTRAKRHPLIWNPPHIRVAARNAVSGQAIPSAFIGDDPLPDNHIGITAYDHSDPFDLEAPDYSLEQFLEVNPSFVASKEIPGAAELSGRVTISGTVIVPKSVPLILKPGTDITMTPRANILCYGGLTSIGSPEQPIRIHGDGSGQAWGAIGIVRPKGTVVLRHTEVSEGGQAQMNGMLFTGGFAVHEGDVDLDSCVFFNMQSEDGFNIKNGHITMKNCSFYGNASDGIDIDFGKGLVENCEFSDINGDALDLSGSEITIANCRFQRIADKGVSVGEDSHPILVNNLFRECDIGFSTKDLSFARVAHSTFVGNRLAIEAKRKKPFFGGASAEVVNSVFAENGQLVTEDYFSKNQVAVKHSVVDRPVAWEGSKTTTVRFRQPEKGDYRLDPVSIAGNGFHLTTPEWLQAAQLQTSEIPGIFEAASLNNQARYGTN